MNGWDETGGATSGLRISASYDVTLTALDGLAVPALAVSAATQEVLASNGTAAMALGTNVESLKGKSFSEICATVQVTDIPISVTAATGPDGEPGITSQVAAKWTGYDGRTLDVSMVAYQAGDESSSLIITASFKSPLDKFTELPRWIAQIVDALPAYVSYTRTDSAGMPEYVNPRGLEMAGVDSVEELWESESVQPVEGDISDRMLATVKAGQIWEDTSAIRNARTGEIIPVERQVYPVYSRGTGEVTAACMIARDISAQIGEKRRSEFLKGVMENLPTAIAIFSPDERLDVLYANKASLELNGVERPEQITDRHEQFIGPGEPEESFVTDTLPRLLAGERIEYQVATTHPMTSETIAIQRLVVPVFGESGDSVVAIASIAMDVGKLFGQVATARNRLAEQGLLMDAVQDMYGEEKRRVEYLEKIQVIASHAMSLLDTHDMLAYVAHSMRQSFDYYLVVIHTVDPDTGSLTLRAIDGVGDSEAIVEPREIPGGPNTIEGWVAASGNEIVIDDTSEQPNYVPIEGWPETRSQLVVPIIHSQKVLGIIDLHSKTPGRFGDNDRSVARILAAQIAVSMENARLFEQVREQTLREERSRFAKEMHDSLVQQLSSIHWQMSALRHKVETEGFQPGDAETLAMMSQLAQESLAETRRSVWNLGSDNIEKNSLARSIRQLVERTGRRSGIEVKFECEDTPIDTDLSVNEGAFLRICQEAVNNVKAHANAMSLTVNLSFTTTHAELILNDDGDGFDARELPAPSRESGYGLVSMQERARLAGGDLEISSSPGHGTQVRFTVPLTRKRAADE